MSNIKLTEIYRSIQESKIILGEALDLATARYYTSIKRNPEIQKRIDSIFNKLSNLKNSKSSKRGDRIYIPLSTDYTSNVNNRHSQKISTDISNVFVQYQYKIDDYFKNKATDEYGRQTKITKLLAKIAQNSDDQNYSYRAKKLLKVYNNDPYRSGTSSKVSLYLVFSKHPYDIAGMSTDRGWTTCMNLYHGEERSYIQNDVKEGTLICYLVGSNDLNINNPIGRVLIKPFVNIKDGSVLYVPEPDKGSVPFSFREQVKKIFQTLQGDKFGRFKLSYRLYCDLDREIKIDDPRFPEFIKNEKVASTVEEVDMVCLSFDIKNYRINEDMSIDVDGRVDIPHNFKIKKLPVKFNKVSGDFFCNWNNLTSLQGAPKEVGGRFECERNSLTSLEGAPQKVGDNFSCFVNDLTSLKGAPKEVGNSFYCSDNDLTSLEGAPEKVDGDFKCSDNKLKSLKGAPKEVGGTFSCVDNEVQFTEEQVRAVSNVGGPIYV